MTDRVRNNYLTKESTTGYWEYDTPLYARYLKRNYKLKDRRDRELKNALYKEFLEFKPTCKPTKIRVWKNSEPFGYVLKSKHARNCFVTDSYLNATTFTDTATIEYLKRLLESNNCKAELLKLK